MEFEKHYKILLELNSDWDVESIEFDHEREEVLVKLIYKSKSYIDPQTNDLCTIYDHRKEREWRHLDTMQYKTFIVSSIPRVQNSQGKVFTIEVPWADG